MNYFTSFFTNSFTTIKNFGTKALFAVLLTFIAAGCGSDAPPESPLLGKIDLQGHRGARGLMPENTIPAFMAGFEWGMDTIELDTVMTAEPDLIVHHDSETNPQLCLQDGNPVPSQPMRTLTIADLKKFDCGSVANPDFSGQKIVPGTKLITLDEFFSWIRSIEQGNPAMKKVQFNIELKFPDVYPPEEEEIGAALMVKIIQKHNMSGRVTVQSFVPTMLPHVKRLDPAIRTSALFVPTYFEGFLTLLGVEKYGEEIIDKALLVQADIISPYYGYVSPGFMANAHKERLLVIPWTVNEEDKMEKLMQLGVDGIISDYPDRLKTAHDKFIQTTEQ